VATAVLVIYFLAYSFPATTQRVYSKSYISPNIYELGEKFLSQHAGERMVVISEDIPFFSLYNDYSVSTSIARRRKEQIKFFVSQPSSPPVYWFYREVYDPMTKAYVPDSRGVLDDDFVLEPIWQENLSDFRRVGFMRIVDVKGVQVEEPEYKNTMDYIRFWGKHLP
jgi:hypothetical protein